MTNQQNQSSLFDYGATAASTRAEAYQDSQAKAVSRRDAIAAYVRSCGDYGSTRDSISIALGMPLQSVTSPVLSLIRDGLLKEDGRKRITSTGSKAAVIVAKQFVQSTEVIE